MTLQASGQVAHQTSHSSEIALMPKKDELVERERSRTYLGAFLQRGLIQELEQALDERKELNLRVGVVDTNSDLRVCLD